MTDSEFEAMMGQLAANREAMPQQAAAAQLARRQALAQALQAQQEAGMAGIKQRLAPYAQSPQALMAQQRSEEYNTLLDPGIARGRGPDMASAGDQIPQELIDKRAQLVAAMNARNAGIAAQRANETEGQRKGRETMAKAKMDEIYRSRNQETASRQEASRNKSAALAFKRGVLNPAAEQYFANKADANGRQIIPNVAQQQAERMAMIAAAGRQTNPRDQAIADLIRRQMGGGAPAHPAPGSFNPGGPISYTPPTPQGPRGSVSMPAPAQDQAGLLAHILGYLPLGWTGAPGF